MGVVMTSTARQTKYAADHDGMVCVLVDVRSRARPHVLLVWSYSKNEIVKLPYRYRNGRELTRVETPEAKRWAAVSMPRWLANDRGLHGRPDLPAPLSGFCASATPDTRTEQQKIDDGERDLAQYVVEQANKYRKLPGQTFQGGKGDARNGAIMA
jgi:hypothetical protein